MKDLGVKMVPRGTKSKRLGKDFSSDLLEQAGAEGVRILTKHGARLTLEFVEGGHGSWKDVAARIQIEAMQQVAEMKRAHAAEMAAFTEQTLQLQAEVQELRRLTAGNGEASEDDPEASTVGE